jgi:hypothetical protein
MCTGIVTTVIRPQSTSKSCFSYEPPVIHVHYFLLFTV